MTNTGRISVCMFLTVLFFVACSSDQTNNLSTLPISDSGMEIDDNHDLTPQPTISPSEITPAIVDIPVQQGCPTLLFEHEALSWLNGSLLYHADEAGIWVYSSDVPSPKLVYDIPAEQSSFVTISPSGLLLYRSHRSDPDDYSTFTPVVYYMETEEEVFLPEQDGKFTFSGWTQDAQLEFTGNRKRILGDGEEYTFLIVDPVTQDEQQEVRFVSLPGYLFAENNPYEGFASVAPTQELVLYTALNEQIVSMVLKDLVTHHIIWKLDNIPAINFPPPYWDSDGENVLFAAPSAGEEGSFLKFFSLSSDGQLESLPEQPLPFIEGRGVRYINRSPDGRYIHFSLWDSIQQGPGFIWDLENSRVLEVCDPEAEFIEGFWLPEVDRFLYLMKNLSGTFYLGALDLSMWQTQVILEAENGKPRIFGWTSIEFP